MQPSDQSFLKQSFETALERHGIWVVYIRAIHEFQCSRCNTAPTEGYGSCPECFGTGNLVRIEKQKVVISKGRRMLPYDTDTVAGLFPDSSFRAYFPVGMRASTGDLILEVNWDTAGEPASLIHAYSLEQVEPYYIEGSAAFHTTKLDAHDHHLSAIQSILTARRR